MRSVQGRSKQYQRCICFFPGVGNGDCGAESKVFHPLEEMKGVMGRSWGIWKTPERGINRDPHTEGLKEKTSPMLEKKHVHVATGTAVS